MTRITHPALSLFLLALISACGGSDGDGTRGSGDDRDGLSDSYETNTSGTSPLLADTDGDGYDDGEEVNERSFNPTTNPFRFNPLVADIPKFEVQVGERPRLTVICTEGTEATREFSTSETNETSSSVSNSQSGEESLALELGVTVGSEASFGTDESAAASTRRFQRRRPTPRRSVGPRNKPRPTPMRSPVRRATPRRTTRPAPKARLSRPRTW